MPTKKKVDADPPPRGTPRKKVAPRKKPQPVKNDSATVARAIRELGINVPIYTTRVVGGRLELHCYGGQVLLWPPASPPTSGGNEGGQ